MNTKRYDVIVVGAGLAGLVSGIKLQQAGKRVLIIERLARAGGLVGTHQLNGFEYVIAANDFGKRMADTIRNLGVDVEFTHPKAKMHFDTDEITLPPNGKTLVGLLKHVPGLINFIRAIRKPENAEAMLGPLVEAKVKNPKTQDLIKHVSYAFGIQPNELPISLLKDETPFKYQAAKFCTPKGGPQVLIDRMLDKFLTQGELKLSTWVLDIQDEGTHKRVVTEEGEYLAEVVVSSIPQWQSYPKEFKSGLSVSMFSVALGQEVKFPKDVHSLIYYPRHVSQWFGQIEAGEQPEDFGFHLFPNYYPGRDYFSVNVYFYLPRGVEALSDEATEALKARVFQRIEKLVPGFNSGIKDCQFIPPKRFNEIHHLWSRNSAFITAPGFQKPGNLSDTGVYQVGNSVYPPGSHAGAAVFSGEWVAEKILDKEVTA